MKKLYFLCIFVSLFFLLTFDVSAAQLTPRDVADATGVSRANATTLLKGLQGAIDVKETQIRIIDFRIPKNKGDILFLYLAQNPDNYALSMGYRYSWQTINGVDYIYDLYPEYLFTAAQCEEIEKAADRILDGIEGNSALSDLEKALLVHERLAVLCEYDTSLLNRSMYNVLVDHSSVCQGYAETYMYLMNRLGIATRVATSEKLNHEWNIVTIDGKEYHVDVTHDDPTKDRIGRVYHKNFLVSSAALYTGGTHWATDYDTAPSDKTYDKALWREINSPFVLLDGKIYYLSYIDGGRDLSGHGVAINTFDASTMTGTPVRIFSYDDYGDDVIWWDGDVPGGDLWPAVSSGLSTDGKALYFNFAEKLCSWTPDTDYFRFIDSPAAAAAEGGYEIYGSRYADGVFEYEVAVNSNVGGKVYSFAYSYAEPAAVFDSQSLTLGGDLGVNIFMKLSDAAKTADAYMEFTVSGANGKTVKVNLSDAVKTGGRYRFTCDINLIQFADTVTATYHYGSESVSRNCSVKTYLQKLVQTSTNEKEKEIARKLISYAHYAQEALSEARGWTIGIDHAAVGIYGVQEDGKTPYARPDTSVSLRAYRGVVSGLPDYVTDLRYSLVLGTRTDIVLYVTTDGTAITPSDLAVSDGMKFAVKAQGNNVYRIVIKNIAANQLGHTYTVTLGSGRIRISALTYADIVLRDAESSDSLKLAVAAMYEYYQAVKAYLAAPGA